MIASNLSDAIVEAARTCVGTPFRHQGRVPGVGLDCAGVAVVAARLAGFGVLDVEGYGRFPDGRSLSQALDAQPFLDRVDVPSRQAGDVLLLRVAGEPQHLAICAGETMVHAYEPAGRCVEHVISAAWVARIVAAYRFTVGLCGE